MRLPPASHDFLTTLLLLTIGLKGGVELAAQPFAALLPQMLVVALTGVLLPLAAYPVLRLVGRLRGLRRRVPGPLGDARHRGGNPVGARRRPHRTVATDRARSPAGQEHHAARRSATREGGLFNEARQSLAVAHVRRLRAERLEVVAHQLVQGTLIGPTRLVGG